MIAVIFLLYENDHNEHNENNGITFLHPFNHCLMLNELEQNDAGWTFKFSPIFVHLYIIHVVIGSHSGHVFPCAYALLPDESTARYKVFPIFFFVPNARLNLAPKIYIIDFEAKTISGRSKKYLRDYLFRVVFFRQTRSVRREFQNVGPVEEYEKIR